MNLTAAAVFTGVFIALYVGHSLGDHWIQTSCQSETKGEDNWAGRLACARHVATLTLTKGILLAPVAFLLDLPLTAVGITLGMGVDAISHYWADRRFTLLRLAQALGREGYPEYVTIVRKPGGEADTTGPGTGSFHLDQSWHHLWLLIAALIIATV
ncbi:transcriptional regulator [Streptomyces sp. NPDC059649]|uniref:transcriptional regulator n=1 Tax=Streptomyces sp. NPDC059649 TaxID=3346895 RepID=UPI00368837AD